MWLCVCACVSQGQRTINLGWHPQEACLSFLRQDLLLAWGSSSRLDWLADKPKCPLVSISPALRLQAGHHAWHFYLGSQDWIQVLLPVKQVYHWLSHVPALFQQIPNSPLKCCVAHKLFCMAQAKLELAVLLLPPGYWGYRCTPSHLFIQCA